MKTENQVAIIAQPELLEVIEKSKLNRSKAEEHAIAFQPFMADYISLNEEVKAIEKVNPTDLDAKKARELRLKIVKIRTGVESVKDARKEVIKAEDGLIMGLFNVVKNSCILTESEAQEIEKHQERIEAKKKAELKDKRESLLAPYEVDLTFIVLDSMPDEMFEKLLADSKDLFEYRKKQAEKAELDRIESERLAAEKLENDRIAKEAEEKRIREENKELKRVQAEKDAELEKIKDEQDKADQEREKVRAKELAELEAERVKAAKIQAEKDKAAKLERDKLQAELDAKKEAEEKELAAKKAALLAPDKEKVNALYISLRDFVIPEFSTDEAKRLGIEVRQGLDLILGGIKEGAKKLK